METTQNSAHSFTEGSEIDCNTANNENARFDQSSIVRHIQEDKPVSEPFLKTPLQLGAMSTDELISYIDKLHNALKGYQVVIDFASNRDLKVS